MRSVFIMLLTLFLIPFFGCEKDLTGSSVDVNGVSITTGDDNFSIRNGTDKKIHLVLIEKETSDLVDWVPYCLDTGHVISPGETEQILFSTIHGYTEGCHVIVWWWSCGSLAVCQ